ncbi:MAG: adenylate/guanylate cyclase domain-containing protein [Rhodocyclales bacterium]|nr:adenylate/guanylate cyclase domain-containing protein [Rhodocyclales bacterium]
MSIHLFSIYGVFRLRFPAAVAAGWISMAMYLVLLSALGLLSGINMYRHAGALLTANLWGMLICYQMDLALRRAFLAVRDVAVEHERSERLLLNILPAELAQELSATGSARPARHESVTILFTDFSGFTQVASSMPAERMVAELNEIFAAFDDITDACGVEKIKTIGDAYMAAAGLPKPCADHAQRCVRAGLDMLAYLENRNRTAAFKWALRVGIHSGPVVAGVVGKRKYAFDIWGDTVNVASRMESSGEIGRVNVSAYTFDLIREEFDCEYRGKLDAKGKGQIDMYFVAGPQAKINHEPREHLLPMPDRHR